MRFSIAVITMALAAAAGNAAAVDAAAAESLVRANGCLECHSFKQDAKKKDGPNYIDVGTKYKNKPNAVDILTKHLTSGPTVNVGDLEEEHKIVKAPPQELKNLIEWILSLGK